MGSKSLAQVTDLVPNLAERGLFLRSPMPKKA